MVAREHGRIGSAPFRCSCQLLIQMEKSLNFQQLLIKPVQHTAVHRRRSQRRAASMPPDWLGPVVDIRKVKILYSTLSPDNNPVLFSPNSPAMLATNNAAILQLILQVKTSETLRFSPGGWLFQPPVAWFPVK